MRAPLDRRVGEQVLRGQPLARDTAPAGGPIAGHDSRPDEDAAPDLLDPGLLVPPLPVRAGEEVLARSGLDRMLEEGHQWLRNGKHDRLLALRGVPPVRARDLELEVREVHVLLLQPEKFALSDREVERGLA